MEKYYVRVKDMPLVLFDNIDDAREFAKNQGVKFRIPRKRKKADKLLHNQNRR